MSRLGFKSKEFKAQTTRAKEIISSLLNNFSTIEIVNHADVEHNFILKSYGKLGGYRKKTGSDPEDYKLLFSELNDISESRKLID